MRIVRRLGFSVAMVTTVMASIVSFASTAGATVLVTCQGTHNSSYDPGLALTPQTVNVHAETEYVTCSASSVTEGTLSNATCLTANLPQTQEVINWPAPGPNSVIAYHTVVSARVAVGVLVTAIGQVTSGLYTGAIAQREILTVSNGQLAIDCLLPGGLQHTTGVANLTILSGP